jgi:hypothetical protein
MRRASPTARTDDAGAAGFGHHGGMPTPPSTRSVKIGDDERGGWSSERPRRGNAPERPADVSVRCRVLSPSDRLRYVPGSLLVVVAGAHDDRDRFLARTVEDQGAILSAGKVRRLVEGKVPADQVDEKAAAILQAAVAKRVAAGQSVVLGPAGLDAEEREAVVRIAAASRRPRHLILLEAARDRVADADREPLNALRRALDAGDLGAEGFHTALRLSGGAAAEVKRIVFRPPPEED